MNDLTDVKIFLASIIRPIVKEALQDELKTFKPAPSQIIKSNGAPIMSAADVKKMTGWPKGTFYEKVAKMPEGIVIRNRSKRLMFNRAHLIKWLQSSG